MNTRILAGVLSLLFVFGAAIESAYAFGISDLTRKKEKKKSRRKKKSKEEPAKKDESAKTDESKAAETKPEASKQDSAAKKDDEGGAEKTAAPAKEENIHVTELPLHAKAWEQYKDLKVGDYTLYEMGGGQMTMRYEVVAKDDKSVTILTSTTMAGRTSKAKMKYVLNSEVKTSEKTIKVGGKDLKVKVMETYTNGKLTSRVMTSDEIPLGLGGVVRNEDGNGKAQMALKEFKKQ